MRRVLLVQHKQQTDVDAAESTETSDQKTREAMRELGAHTCGQLQARKVSDAQIIATEGIEAGNLSIFYQAMVLTNYDSAQKGDVPETEEEKKKWEEKPEEEKDERTKRKKKVLDSFSILHETTELKYNPEFQFQSAAAQATCFARNLANTRGSIGNPAWMEHQITDLISQKKSELI